MEGHWKFVGGGGVLKAKILEAKCEVKLEFPGPGRGVQNKKPSTGVWAVTLSVNVIVMLSTK